MSPRADGGMTSPSGEYECCINDAYYSCPDEAAFNLCATGGFDVDACLRACGGDDFDCIDECFMRAEEGFDMIDPSQYMRIEALDGTCGSASCTEDTSGRACDINSDCSSSNNCSGNRCS